MPGQTWDPTTRTAELTTFNGGPGNCPAKRSVVRPIHGCDESFNGGPGNCPAKRASVGNDRHELKIPSMEGRAIARPNRRRRRPHAAPDPPSMEGRAIARPNMFSAITVFTAYKHPSMEGRAIARPNWAGGGVSG